MTLILGILSLATDCPHYLLFRTLQVLAVNAYACGDQLLALKQEKSPGLRRPAGFSLILYLFSIISCRRKPPSLSFY